MLFVHFDRGAGEGIDTKYLEDDVEAQDDEEIAGKDNPKRNVRPRKAVIERWHDQGDQEPNRCEKLDDLLGAGFFRDGASADATREQSRIAFPQVNGDGR